jgi:hypothetical protein
MRNFLYAMLVAATIALYFFTQTQNGHDQGKKSKTLPKPRVERPLGPPSKGLGKKELATVQHLIDLEEIDLQPQKTVGQVLYYYVCYPASPLLICHPENQRVVDLRFGNPEQYGN